MKDFQGYQADFLGPQLPVPLPRLNYTLALTVAPVKNATDNVLRYPNYSTIQSASRKLPIVSAANIDGRLFQEITRATVGGGWKKDRRISYNHQLGLELYRAPKSDFDKGHMTKREDVQWGPTPTLAQRAAKHTFYYTNAAPQHKKVNQAIWRNIEDYILHSEATSHSLRINVFTGPVLLEDDPIFVTKVRGQEIQIPTLFWKVIYYTKGNQQLFRVAFLVGQDTVLEEEGIVFPRPATRGDLDSDLFMDFSEADTYQVKTELIEILTGLSFPEAIEVYWDQRPSKLILQQVSVRGLDDVSTVQNFVEGLIL